MNRMRWLAVLSALVMLAGAALAHVARPTKFLADQQGSPDLEALFPKSFDTWRVDVSIPQILPAPDVQARLDLIYNQVLSRTYVNDVGQQVMLSVAYGGDQSDATRAHLPEVCYPVQGFDISANVRAVLHLDGGQLEVRRLMAHQGVRNEPITYWVVVGERVALSAMDQKLAQLRYGMRGIIADGMLVRVSSIDRNTKHAHEVHASFITALARGLPDADRARIFGELQD
jgi:EpsI family protein